MSSKISDLVLYTIKSPSRYSETQPEVLNFIKSGSSVECKQLIDQLKKLIKDKRVTPSQKVLVLELFHSCMMLKRPDFIQISENRMTSLFTRLASKTSQTIFSDSCDSFENKSSSETFFNNLLAYIYIWANDLSLPGIKKQSEFIKMFYKLRETVDFSASCRRSSKTLQSPVPVNPSQSLKKILNSLEILESMADPTKEETGRDLIQGLSSAIPALEGSLQKSLEDKNQSMTNKIQKVLNRVQKFTQNSGHTLKKESPRPATSNSTKEKSKVRYSDLEQTELRLENSGLKKTIIEKNLVIENLQKRMKLLEEAYLKTKELLLSKEQECAECHVVKESLRRESQVLDKDFQDFFSFAQKNNQPGPVPSLFSSISVGPKPENSPEEIDNFKLTCCGKSNLLLQNELVTLTFETALDQNCLVFDLDIFNSSQQVLINLEVETDKSFGYDIIVTDQNLQQLKVQESTRKRFFIKQLCLTHIFPSLSLKFDLPDKFLEYTFEIPVHFLSYSKTIQPTPELLLREFELLAFDSEVKKAKCRHSLRRCRKMLKFSSNVQIFSGKSLENLSSFQLFLAFSLEKISFVVFSLSPVEQICTIEVRSESLSIRKTCFSLIINQIT